MSETEQYNILVVDEDEATRCTLVDLLRGRDEYRVLVAGEGREAVRIFVEEARIDIVLTDIQMPGFNCLELMSDMQRLKHRPEILVMTSNESAEVIEQARQIGARSIILKPFEHLDLIEAEVEKVVRALFEARATTSCKMMVPPSVKRDAAATAAMPPPAAAKPESAAPASGPHSAPSPTASPPTLQPAPSWAVTIEEDIFIGKETPTASPAAPNNAAAAASAVPVEVAEAPPIMASPPAVPDAGLTIKIDRSDFAIPPHPPSKQTTPDPKELGAPAVGGGGGAKPVVAAIRAPSGESSGRDTRHPPAADRKRGRVGLPNLGALKTKLFGKGTDLSGGHLARGGFSDLALAGGSPASPPATPAARSEAAPEASVVQPAADRHDRPLIATPAPPAPRVEPAAAAARPASTSEPAAPPVERVTGPEPLVSPVERAATPEPVVAPVEPPAETNAGPHHIEPSTAASAPATPAASAQKSDADSADRQERVDDSESPTAGTGTDEPVEATAENVEGDDSLKVPAELETILTAGADIDIEKLKVQIPIICLQTWEEQAALDALCPLAGAMKRAFHTWSATRGIVKEDGTVMGEMYCDPIQALEFIRRQKANGLYVLIDFRNCLDDRKVVRMMREMFEAGETGRGMLVLTAPVIPIPPELQPACRVFDWPRGGSVDFDQVLGEVRIELTTAGGDAVDLDPETRRLLIERVKGMPVGRARFEFLCALRGREQRGG